MKLTACTVYVNVCLQSVSDTAAITTWWQRCTVIQVNTAFCVTSYLELWHGITSPTNGGQHASTNARLFLKHHRQAIQHKYKINALVIRASKQCSDCRRVYNCCNVWWNWNKQSSLSVSSQVTTTDVTIIEIEIEIVFLTEKRIESKSYFSCIPSNDLSIEALDRL